MTEDYKDTLLKYFTGNINDETDNNVPIFNQQVETLNKNIYENISTILTNQESATNINVLGKIYNETYSAYLIYGTYLGSNSTHYGYIYLVDDNLEEIQMITEFASGTTMFPIYALNQAEDGNLYGLSYDGTSTTRILLFNNIFASGLITGEYRAVLRNDYIVPYSYNPAQPRQNRIIKSPESATYYLILNETNNSKVGIVKFVINVGSSNEWRNYEIEKTILARFDVKLDKVLGDERLSFYCIDAGSSTVPSNYYEYQLVGDTVTLNKTITLQSRASFTYSQVFVRNENNIYIFACHPTEGVLYKVNGNNVDVIYNFDFVSSGSGYYLSYIDIFQIDNDIFLKKKFTLGNNTYDLSLAYLNQNNQIYWYYVGETGRSLIANTFYDYIDFYPKVTYNLVSLCVPIYSTTNTTKKYTFDFNSLNYNGTSYENTNSLLPIKGRLYDTNDKMIFARNLYNKTLYNNTTLSQIQIPNTLLNDVTILQQNLVGATNKTLTANENDITKNIYETVYLNFYNTLGIQDRNLIPFTNNLIGAERINKSTSNLLDYDNAKATKYRLNYSDNTTFINYLPPALITSKTVSGGNSLYITDSKQGNALNYSVDGATEQNGTPTPSSPQEIKTIPSIINLLNYETSVNGSIPANSTSETLNSDSHAITSAWIPCKPNTTYTISGGKNRNRWQTKASDGTISYFASDSATITTNSTAKYLRCYYYYASSSIEPTSIQNVQIEEGTVVHEYIPYGHYARVKVTGKNLFSGYEDGYINSSNGADESGTGKHRSFYIPVKPNTTYTTSTLVTRFCEYNKNKGFIQCLFNTSNSVTTTANTYYLRLGFNENVTTATLDTEMLEEGTTSTTYEEYKEKQVLIDLSKENLIDIDELTFKNGYYSSTGVWNNANTNGCLEFIKVSPSTIYTITKNTKTDNMSIVEFNENKEFIKRTQVYNSITYTFTTDSTTNYIAIVYNLDSSTTMTKSLFESWQIQLFNGTSPTPYYELCSIGDNKDRLVIDSTGNCVINKKIGKVVLNGSETVNKGGTTSNQYFNSPVLTNYIKPQDNNQNVPHFSTHFINKSPNELSGGNVIGSTIRRDNAIGFAFGVNSEINTVAKCKTWLSNNKPEFYYQMETPETITLPNTQIPLYEGINHITFVDNLETSTSMNYQVPTKSTYTITIYVPSDKTINNLEIISEDENTVYQTIDTSSLENSKIYKITQNCYVE